MRSKLSKTRFQTGLQCHKALWLSIHDRAKADPVPASRQAVFDAGTALGELARTRWPDGVLVVEDHTQSRQALNTTTRIMKTSPPAVFEAAFEHAGVFVRPDILVRVSADEWDLVEVKSSTKVKPENFSDVAIQMWVLEGAGVRIRSAYLMHLDSTYSYDGVRHDVQRLFVAENVTEDARAWIETVPAEVEAMSVMLDGPLPERRIGKHCDRPYTCAFHGHCHAFLPVAAVTELPRITETTLETLLDAGIHRIDEVPLDTPGLSTRQRTTIETMRRGTPRIVGDLNRTLEPLRYPIHFLDFETVGPGLPLYVGTHPYEAVAFQFSIHVLHEDGHIEHREYLCEEPGDPRAELTEHLLAALGETGSIVHYSPYEVTQLKRLSAALSSAAARLDALVPRLFDLERVVYTHVEHPGCMGRTTIKAVLPALVPDLTYSGLDIQDGNDASLRYLRALQPSTPALERSRIFDSLLEYCKLDSLAMLRLLEVLRKGRLS